MKGTKTFTNAEAQLIGHGARHYLFKVNDKQSYVLHFEDESRDSLLLEALYYHTILTYNKRIPNYNTSRMRLLNDLSPQQVTYRTYHDQDFFIYDSAVINQTEAQLIDRIGNYIE